jgi:hypothetical protein
MEIFVAPVVFQLSVLLCPRMMLVGLALKELIVGFVAARAAAPPSATQAVKISAINTVLAHSSAAVPRCTVSNRAVLCSTVSNRAALRSAVSNRPFPARSIFIFRLGLAYAPPGLRDTSTSKRRRNRHQQNFARAHFQRKVNGL